MNTSNPFQIPVCLQRADMEQRRRERFKKAVVTALAATVALLIGLLIEGCVSEHTKTASLEPVSHPVATVAVAAPAPVSVPAPGVKSVAIAPAVVSVPASAGHPDMIYIVKSGDTLSRIAVSQHSSVKAIKAVNGMKNDRIIVGLKLRIPQA